MAKGGTEVDPPVKLEQGPATKLGLTTFSSATKFVWSVLIPNEVLLVVNGMRNAEVS